MAKGAHNLAGKAHCITFADWQSAAISGYVAGGASPVAAAEIVASASENVSPLVTRELTGEMFQTFLLVLDLECGRYVRRHGAAFFVGRD